MNHYSSYRNVLCVAVATAVDIEAILVAAAAGGVVSVDDDSFRLPCFHDTHMVISVPCFVYWVQL